MDFNPMMAPPPMAAAPAKKGGNTTLYIVIFFLCVISVMAGTFHFQTQSAAAKAAAELEKIQADTAAKMAAAQSDFEKQQIQAEAAEKARSAQLKANVQAREAQLKKLEAKVNADLAAAAKTVKNANDLKAAATKTSNDAVRKLKEAEDAQKKADESGKENDKKLAAEKKKLAADAAKKVAAANKKATAAAAAARAEATKARQIKQKLDKVNITLKGNANEIAAAKYNAVPGYQIPGRKGKGNKFNVSGPKVCIDEAKKLKANVWGYRGNNHPTKKYKKSCFFYGVPSGNTFSGLNNDSIHMIGCAYGGNPRTGCDPVPKIVSAKSIKKATVKDKKIYLYRKFAKSKRYCYKSGNDIKCSSKNKYGNTKKFIIRTLADGKVALKVKNKWCADESDKVKCNRSAIGGWEKFTIKQHGRGFKLKGGKDGKWCRRVSNKIRCDQGAERTGHTFYSTKR